MAGPPLLRRPVAAVFDLVAAGALPGLVLIGAAVAAMIVANSPAEALYAGALRSDIGPLTLHQWINDGLMALFFFQVGLEVKREIVSGALSTVQARRVPVVAAICGMVAPALVYLAAIRLDATLARGWAIASATDIAFALGVLTLLGSRVPASLKLLLTTIAIADDVGAVAIIALAYTRSLDPLALAAAVGLIAVLWMLNRRGVRAIPLYAIFAMFLWIAVHRSGVHATIAGVAAALFVPLGDEDEPGPLERLEHGLAPWLSYLVLPLFGFANAGIGLGAVPLIAPLPIAVMLGLFAGKQIGVFAALRAMAWGGAGPPREVGWAQLYGVALLAGIGFTMSLFIGDLAFDDPLLIEQAKIGILAGSLLSALAGYCVLRFAPVAPRE